MLPRPTANPMHERMYSPFLPHARVSFGSSRGRLLKGRCLRRWLDRKTSKISETSATRLAAIVKAESASISVVIIYCNVSLPLLLTVISIYLGPLLTLSCVTGSPTPATTSQSYLSHAHGYSCKTVPLSLTP